MFNIPTVTVAKTTLETAAETVTLTYVAPSVSWTPRHLVIRWSARSNESVSVERGVSLRFNGDTGSNYNDQRLDGAVEAETSGIGTNATNISQIGVDTGDDSAAYGWSSGFFLIPDALSTRTHKSVVGFSAAIEQRIRSGAGRWANTAAITSISLSQDGDGAFLAGTTVELCVVDESFNIDEQILSSTGAITVSSIPAGNGDLVQIGNFKDARENAIANTISMQLNGDTSSSYDGQRMLGVGASPSAATLATGTSAGVGHCPSSASGSVAAEYGAYVAHFPNYADGSNDRIVNSLGGYHISYPYSLVSWYSNKWNNTAAINSIKLFHLVGAAGGTGFVANSMLSTYSVPKNLIGRHELAADTTSVTFSSIPQTYDHLELSVYARAVGTAVGTRAIGIDVNADSTATNYTSQVLYGQDSTIVAYQADNQYLFTVPAQTAGANHFGGGSVTFYNYANTDRHKHYLAYGGYEGSNNSVISMKWESQAAISSLVVNLNADTLVAGSVFELRGVHADIAPAAGGASDVAALNGIAPADIEAVN